MSMYVDLLSGALDEWSEELAGAALVAYAAACRKELLTTERQKKSSAYARLSAEIAYDCALVKLCRDRRIEVSTHYFDRPRSGRMHVERALEAAGIDLAAKASHRGRRRTTISPTGTRSPVPSAG